MKFDLGFLTVQWKKKDTSARRGKRPPTLSVRDKWDRAEEAAHWILRRYHMGAPYSRRRRPRGMTEQAYNNGYRLLHLADIMYDGEMMYRPRQSDTAKAGLRLTVTHVKERYVRQKENNPSIVLPF